jgi:hypothetical protein
VEAHDVAVFTLTRSDTDALASAVH